MKCNNCHRETQVLHKNLCDHCYNKLRGILGEGYMRSIEEMENREEEE